MAVTAEEIYKQVLGAIQPLEKLSAKVREQPPYKEFGEHYNKLLVLAKEAMPKVDARRWPPSLQVKTATNGPSHVDARYVEIHSYMNQIAVILAEEVDPLVPKRIREMAQEAARTRLQEQNKRRKR